MQLADQIKTLTGRIRLRSYRLLLDTPGVSATVPMIRGVWGQALLQIDENVYRSVFAGEGPPHFRLPRYALRPAPPDPATAPAIEWILFTVDGADIQEAVLLRAWHAACSMGLGPNRTPFRIREFTPLGPTGKLDGDRATDAWPLSMATWPTNGSSAAAPCQVNFGVPLRLTRRGRLLLQPNYSDIAVAAVRRIASLANCGSGEAYRDLIRAVRAEASYMPATPWRGGRQDLVRWSGAQNREIDLYGVVGGFGLPEGPGRLWPLLAAARWTHIGKGTVFGLGQPEIHSLNCPE